MMKAERKQVAGLVAACLLLASACARSTQATSGETHFLVCAVDSDCAPLGADFACVAARCRLAVDVAGKDASVPSHEAPDARTGEDASLASCGAGCSPVYGYGESAAGGCVDRSQRELLGCDCDTEGVLPRCMRRLADGRLWVLHASGAVLDSGFAECTSAELERVSDACEFAACAVPPHSTCNVADTCADRDCGNVQYDSDGCRRPPCKSDVECGDDERCVPFDCAVDDTCRAVDPGPDELCDCAGPFNCKPGAACNPVSAVGPRGAWQRLEVLEGSGNCPADCEPDVLPRDCCVSRVYTLEPSGALAIAFGAGDPEPRMAMLSVGDQTDVSVLIDGPSIRAGLRDGFACQREEPGALEEDTRLRVVLAGITLEQNVENCLPSGDSDVARLRQMLRAY